MKALKITNKPAGHFTFNDKAFSLRRVNTQRDDANSRVIGGVMHHTGTVSNILYDGYQFNITEIDKEVYIFQTLEWSEKGQHLWGRNSGLASFTFCCLATGLNKPTEGMIKAMGMLIGEISAWKNIPIDAKLTMQAKKIINGDLVNVSNKIIKIPTFTDHAEYAKFDGYFPDRWDVGDTIKNTVISIAKKHFNDLKSNKVQFMFKELM